MLNTIMAYIERIVAPRLEISEQKFFVFFARQLLKRLSRELFEEFSEESLSALTLQAWNFFKKKPAAQSTQTQCVLGKIESLQGASQCTALFVLNPNVPFLVDSLQLLFNTAEVNTFFVLHPVFLTKRDSEGCLLATALPKTELKGAQEESLIVCLVNDVLDSSESLALEQKMHRLCEKVIRIVEAWPDMRLKSREIVALLPESDPHLCEIRSFFQWIDQGHFTFLGHHKYQLSPEGKWLPDPETPGLGILHQTRHKALPILFQGVFDTPEAQALLVSSDPLLMLAKTSQKSQVDRAELMDAVGFKVLNAEGNVQEIHHFLGLFTARAHTQSARDIPIVRLKVRAVLEKLGLDSTWHDGKRLIHILETLPRDELFQSSVEDLAALGALGLGFQIRGPVRLFVRYDLFGRYVSCFVYVPRDHYRAVLRSTMAHCVASFFQGTLAATHVHLESLPFAWIHCLVHLTESCASEAPLKDLEKQLTALSLTWQDRLKKAWVQRLGEKKGYAMYRKSCEAFSGGYAEQSRPEEAIQDFQMMSQAIEWNDLRLTLDLSLEDPKLVRLRIYVLEKPLLLKDLIGILENMGLAVTTETHFKMDVSPEKPGYIHIIDALISSPPIYTEVQEPFAEAFKKTLSQETENDGFNRLVLTGGLSWRECLVFRSYSKYLKQIRIPYSQAYLEDTLARHPKILNCFLRLFHGRFDPSLASQRDFLQERELKEIRKLLEEVTHPNDESALRLFLSLMLATLRTNFYQKLPSGQNKPYLSFKFECEKIEGAPSPLPLYEIFVYSPRFEGVHLRGGKVSRGGLRWSDRQEDYRTEILDLMQTQMVKNAVTVPTGAKGGFIVKTALSPEQWAEEGRCCYEMFVRGLLDLTDNRVDSRVEPPSGIVPWDDPDPYLVVAADKGTAARSNDANALAQEYKFWLGDAFASGGSHGYNHKEMAITSRGAWKSVEHHFKEINIDPQTTPFTVMGIGDMSGDVFGNGMLLSQQIRLVGAFDHRDIFLDPNPDPTVSYAERLRLFQMPTSSWQDYDRSLISSGGGVFSRALRTIPLPLEMQSLLGVSDTCLKPNALIRALLKTPVDLLWFGGIGTFVKSSLETNLDVLDRINDSIRINGNEVGARTVVEGGNLGCTQRGRIEYALSGGRINTDALDNSGGVSCSDHEVNLKILFEGLIKSGQMRFEERNALLVEMTDEVAQLVLHDNYWQNQAVSLASANGPQLLEAHGRLIAFLESQGKLDRSLEILPTDEELQQRQALKLGLTCPELAVLLSYSKIDLSCRLVTSEILEDPSFESVLLQYFPKTLRGPFREACLEHPLRREITATLLTNIVVNTLGPSFVNEICELTGVRSDWVFKAIWITRQILQYREIEKNYLNLTNSHLQRHGLQFVDRVMKRLVIWFLRHENMEDGIESIVHRYLPGFNVLRQEIFDFLPKPYGDTLTHAIEMFFEADPASQTFGTMLQVLEPLSFAPDIIQVGRHLNKPLLHVARLYYALGEFLGLRWIGDLTDQFDVETPWQRKALREIREQILLIQQQLTLYILSSYSPQEFNEESMLNTWSDDHRKTLQRYMNVLKDVQKNHPSDISPFVVLERELERLYEKIAGMCTMTASY